VIDPHWQLVDLDPRTWRNIGRFINPGQYIRAGNPDEHALYVLHDDGRVLNAVDTKTGPRRDLGIERVTDPTGLAERLHAGGEWERVHVIDRRHLAAVSANAQATPRRELTLDAHYRKVYDMFWDRDEGYVASPPHPGHWNHWTYAGIKGWVDALPQPASLALGVFDGSELTIGLIAEISDSLIRRLTTFEVLPQDARGATLSAESLERVWDALEAGFFPPAAVMLCSATVFEAWIECPDKAGYIRAAAATGRAYLRLADGVAPRP